MQTICETCKCPKDSSEFYASKNKSSHESSCKTCSDLRHYERRRERRIEQGLTVKFPTLASRHLATEGMKYCPTCKQVKKLDEFSTMKVRSGVASHCRECAATRLKVYYTTPEAKQLKQKYYKQNREKAIDRKLQKKFGITYSQYKATLAEQNGVCAICGRTPEENKKMLAVDHDHNTGKNRGILCASCNICIGFIEKNRLDFSQLIAYYQRHNINGQRV